MKVVVQRVSEASVSVSESPVGEINRGLCLFQGVEQEDNQETCDQFVKKILSFRIFPDEEDRMNRDLREVGGDLILVPNFTLCAETESGTRPGFGPAASPDEAEKLFDYTLNRFHSKAPGKVAAGEFGAMMNVSLSNDGPVTFVLQF